jgi:hypothetical protein
MLQEASPDDYVIATGRTTSVPRPTLETLIKMMVDADMERVARE